jgi:hypothetical protein
MSSLTSSDLLVSVKGISTKERRGTSQWLFSSGSVHYEGTSSPQQNCTRYRAELFGILSVLFIVYRGEQHHPVVSSCSILLECGHDRALKEAFQTSLEGVTTATQPNSDIIMDIRHLRHLISTRIQPICTQPQLDPPFKQQEGLKPIRSREQVQLIHFLEETDQELRSYQATVCVGHNTRHLFPPKQAGWPIRIYFTRASIFGKEIRVTFISSLGGEDIQSCYKPPVSWFYLWRSQRTW